MTTPRRRRLKAVPEGSPAASIKPRASGNATLYDLTQLVEEHRESREAYEDAQVRDRFASSMRAIRQGAGLTQTDLATSMNSTQSFVSELEAARSGDIYLGTAQRWARGLGHRVDVGIVPRVLPSFGARGLPNVLWSLIHKYSLSPILTALVTAQDEPEKRTAAALAAAADMPEGIVRAVLASLTNRKWVVREHHVTSQEKNGAKSDVYSLNSKAAYVIGVSLHPGHVEGVLLDAYAQVVHHAHTPTSDTEPETMLDASVLLIKQMRHIAVEMRERDVTDGAQPRDGGPAILGVGVSIAGVVEPWLTGAVKFAADLKPEEKWKKYPLEFELQARLETEFPSDKMLVAIENDANALALLEYWTSGDPTACAILMSDAGVGVGFMANGDIVYGRRHAGGEGGHTIVDPSSVRPCRLGLDHNGCLETLASAHGIIDTLVEAGLIDATTASRRPLNKLLSMGSKLVSSGNDMAKHAFLEAGRAVGAYATMLAATVDPARIAIYGHAELIEADSHAAAELFRQGFAESWKGAESRRSLYGIPEIEWKDLQGSTNAIAAGAAAMRQFLAHPTDWSWGVAPNEVSGVSTDPTVNTDSDPVEVMIDQPIRLDEYEYAEA